MTRTSLFLSALFAVTLFAGPIACGGEEGDADQLTAEAEDELIRGGFGATGDYCEYPAPCPTCMTLPGRENDAGQCCKTTDPNDCAPILKPFPTATLIRSP